MHGYTSGRPLFWLLIWLFGLQPVLLGQSRQLVPDYAAAIAKLKSAIDFEVELKQLPALSIALVSGDQQLWAEGFGYQDTERSIPATAETIYRVGSVSKLFTDMAVMQLVEQGILDLDAGIQLYLPEFAPQRESKVPITLRMLMSHRSGLVREPPVGHYFDPNEPSLEETIASLNQTRLVYEPNTKTKYSNAAVSVVGRVLESQTGLSYAEQIRRSILRPLNMDSSNFSVTADMDSKTAVGWMRTYDGRRFEAPTFQLGTGPAGSLYSSVNDLSKFLVWMFKKDSADRAHVLSADSFQQMTSPVVDAAGKPQQFGLGFHLQTLDGLAKIGHGGAIYGFSTQLEALPERRLGVVAACALDGSNGVVSRLADYALRLMLAVQAGRPLADYPHTDIVPSERANKLAGSYVSTTGQQLTHVTYLAPDLYMQHGSYRYALRATADEGKIVVDDPLGFGLEVALQDGDRLKVGDSLLSRAADEPPPEAPEGWRAFIGEYGWDHNTLYVLEDAGQLYVLIEWFYYYPLTEVSENVFQFPGYGLYQDEQLVFEREPGQQATAVVAAEVRFQRRETGTKDGETFRITPLKPIDELRAAALQARPPEESGEFRESDLVDLATLNPNLKLDIRYATTNNFTGAVFYRQPRALMQRPAAEALLRAHRILEERGLGLLIHDAYRPWHVTKMFWDATPNEFRDFVANPANGSRHNRGCAVDLTLFDLKTGVPIQMVAGYDEFSTRSFPLYPGGTYRSRWYRDLLRRTMENVGFTVYQYEWWHFDYRDWQKYRIGNQTFEDISR